MDNNYNNDQQNVTPDFNNQAPVDPYNGSVPTPDGPKGKAIASMVLGICAVVGGCCIWSWLGLILGVIAVVLGALVLKNKEAGKGFAIAGLVCGIVGVVWSIVALIIVLALGEAATEFVKAFNNNNAIYFIK